MQVSARGNPRHTVRSGGKVVIKLHCPIATIKYGLRLSDRFDLLTRIPDPLPKISWSQ